MPSDTLSDSQRAIIAHCTQHQELHRRESDFRRCTVFEGRFIKYGCYGSLYPQYETQQYISRFADGDRACHAFLSTLNLNPPPPRTPPKGLQRLSSGTVVFQLLPMSQLVLAGGLARHWLFKDFTAPLPFSSIEALERYMNKARDWIHRNGRPDAVSFSGEQSLFTQSNTDERNFPEDTEGNTCLLDFEDVGLLPESFASYTMSGYSEPFVSKVAEYLHWPASRNLRSMGRFGSILQMIGDSTLGLNEDGWPRSRS